MNRQIIFQIVFSTFLLGAFLGCKKSSDDSPQITPPDNTPELSTDVRLMVFNASSETGDINVTISNIAVPNPTSLGENSDYYLFDEGEIAVVIQESATGNELLRKNLPLEGGYFYSSYFYIDEEDNPQLLLAEDYPETKRIPSFGGLSVNIVAVNLTKNLNFDDLDIYNTHTSFGPNGIVSNPANARWIDDLPFGAYQKNEMATIGSDGNSLSVTPGQTTPTSIPQNKIDISGLGAFATVQSNGNYVIAIYDNENQEGAAGKMVNLSNIDIAN